MICDCEKIEPDRPGRAGDPIPFDSPTLIGVGESLADTPLSVRRRSVQRDEMLRERVNHPTVSASDVVVPRASGKKRAKNKRARNAERQHNQGLSRHPHEHGVVVVAARRR